MLVQRQAASAQRILRSKHESLALQAAKLDALSPLAVLTRGFSIVQLEDGSIVRDADRVGIGAKLKIRLEKGRLNAEVTGVE